MPKEQIGINNGTSNLEMAVQPENHQKTERMRRSFFNTLKNKLTAMALAGFVTLGGGWEQSFADQLRIKVNKDKGTHAEFTLETALTDEKILVVQGIIFFVVSQPGCYWKKYVNCFQ